MAASGVTSVDINGIVSATTLNGASSSNGNSHHAKVAKPTTPMADIRPMNPLVSPILTDMYQLSMTYAYWKAGREAENAVFDLYFRKNPFKGQFTIFAGLGEALALVKSFRFTESDIDYLRQAMPACEPAFFEWLSALDCSEIRVYALQEGAVCFPKVPLLRVEGPLAVGQLLETPLLNLVNYPSLVATNAARHRLAAGPTKTLLEFGLRRAQGPDGALSASRYSYIGGFDGTSNLLAGKLLGITVKGTHAHAFVQSYSSFDQIKDGRLGGAGGPDLIAAVLAHRKALNLGNTHSGELAAFVAYALAFPDGFLALVDTYDTLYSGVPNFVLVALALDDLGHKPIGIRLDSGDLAFLSKEVRRYVSDLAEKLNRPWLRGINIVASNDINEQVLHELGRQGHEIDTFGIGTNLVTCQDQPALGCVYKLVEIEGQPRIKISQTKSKITVPGSKRGYRLFGQDGKPLLDLLQRAGEAPPEAGKAIYCRHPFEPTKRALVTPSDVKPLHSLFWDGPNGGLVSGMPDPQQVRATVAAGIAEIREDTLRVLNPTPYKVSVSEELYEFLHTLWEREAPIKELS